jgi:hypothetical protein
MTLDWIDQTAYPIRGSLLFSNDVQRWLNQKGGLRGYTAQEIQRAIGQLP